MELKEKYQEASDTSITNDHYENLRLCISDILETYSNVHRGSGHNSLATTHLYEKAREIVLDYLDLDKRKYVTIFCTPARARDLVNQFNSEDYKIISSADFGLKLGVTAVAFRKNLLPRGIPFQSGGGTTRLYSKEWVIWSDIPDKFEAGTPAIVNVIAFSETLFRIKQSGKVYSLQSNSQLLPIRDILYDDEFNECRGRGLLEKLRETLIGKDIRVPTIKGTSRFINLDNSASTRTFRPVFDSFFKTLTQPQSVQKEVINETRNICAEFIGAPLNEYDIIFTSNTTESVNFITRNTPPEKGTGTEPVILNTILEHSSNDLPWRNIPGYSVIKLGVDKEGFYDLNELEKMLSDYNHENNYGNKRIKIAAMNAASNVLGSCNDIEAAGRIVHKYGALLFVDAAQLISHRPVNIKKSGIDFLAFSAHKVYAPFGCGVLAVKKGAVDINPDELEKIRLSGEENASGIAALGKSLLLLKRIGFETIIEEERELTKKTLTGMAKIDGLRLYGVKNLSSTRFENKIGVIVFEIKRNSPWKIAKQLAMRRGIGVRFGCHCAHIIIKYLLDFTPRMEKIQKFVVKLVPILNLPGLVRISFGLENTKADVEALLDELNELSVPDKKVPSEGIQELTRREYKKKLKDYISSVSEKIYH